MTVLADAAIERLVTSDQIIEPFDKQLLQGASYDLRLGKQYTKSKKILMLTDENLSIVIEPGAYVIISTFEHLNIPLNIVGRNGLISIWAKRGLVCLFGAQIDPGFQGCLFVPLFNAGDEEITITLKDPIITVEFLRTTENASFSWSQRKGRQISQNLTTPSPAVVKPNTNNAVAIAKDVDNLKLENSTLYAKLVALEAKLDGIESAKKYKSQFLSMFFTMFLAVAALIVSIIFAGPVWEKLNSSQNKEASQQQIKQTSPSETKLKEPEKIK